MFNWRLKRAVIVRGIVFVADAVIVRYPRNASGRLICFVRTEKLNGAFYWKA